MSSEVFSVEIELPYVEGEVPTVSEPGTYDDSADFYVHPAGVAYPAANLMISPGGPCEMTILGFSTDGLRKLAAFLVKSADLIDAGVAAELETRRVYGKS